MPNLNELTREVAQKQGEFSHFLKVHTTPDGEYDFNVTELKEFNDRSDELNRLVDSRNSQKSFADAASKLDVDIADARRVGGSIPFAGGNGAAAPAIKSMGEMFEESAAFKAHADKPASVTGQWAVDLPYDSIKAALTTTSGQVGFGTQIPGVVGFATRRPVMRDLMPVSETNDKFISYIEQNVQTFGAAPVVEGAVKPETTLGTTRRQFNLETIAHYIKVTNQALDFIPGVRDMINQQGTVGLQLAEEDQILSGSGTSPNLQGFLTKSGLQTQALGADDQFTAFMKAMTKVQSTVGFANVTGGAINPNDWQQIVTLKDSTGRFIYGDPFAATAAPRLWGIPLVPTIAITEGTALIGDFLMYSRLWLNGGIRILVGYVGDDLIRNQQTILVEEYAALQISRPSAFCTITGI